MKQETAFFGFNRGLVSPLALARVDMKRVALAAETMENWIPRVLGSMMLRPGWEYIGETASNNQARFIPFIFATTDTALLEITNTKLRIWVDEALLTRGTVAAAVTNGDFTANVAGWTDNDAAGAASAWSANYGGSLELIGTGTASAIRDQQVVVAGGDIGEEHALRITISRGPVEIFVGSTSGGNEYVDSSLDTGTHSIAFTPTGDFFIRLRNSLAVAKYVSDCNVEAAGVIELPTPWTTDDLRNIRYDQSGDIVFIACKGFLQRAIERRNATSWSVVSYVSDTGPFGTENTTDLTLAVSGTTGNVTLTASRSLFEAGHVATGLFAIRSGATTGIGRVTSFSTGTSVGIEVLSSFASTTAAATWTESLWSGVQGFPSAVSFYEGRLWWSGKNGIWGSVSDDFYDFDITLPGDSASINRTIGAGPVDSINWMLPLQRLIVGADGAEWSVRANSFDEVLTPSNFNIKRASSLGSASAIAVQIDSRGVFVQRGGTRIFELAMSSETSDYASKELTLISPEVGEPSIVHVAVQRLPDTRVHCVRSDGKVAIMIQNVAEDVASWVLVSSPGGEIEDVVVLPGTVEDNVYYVVKRTINGATKRYLEWWAREADAAGGVDNFIADSFFIYQGGATTTITGLSHLEGETVSVWGNSKDLGQKIVMGGQIDTLSESVTYAIIGIPYTAQWKSTKLSTFTAGQSNPLGQPKRVVHVGLVLANAFYQAVEYGSSFDDLEHMPAVEDGQIISQDTLSVTYDKELFEFDGLWDADARLCLQAQSPRPVTVLAATLTFNVEYKS